MDRDRRIEIGVFSLHVAEDTSDQRQVHQIGNGEQSRAQAIGVHIEAQYTVGEYDILILSAKQSDGLETWLKENGYTLPRGLLREPLSAFGDADILLLTRAGRDYPHAFAQIIAHNDFSTSFLWISERMDLLPAFSFGSVALLGDAAHPLLAFTSQGANSALEDAACLAALLSRKQEEEPASEIFHRYYRKREPNIRRYIAEGDQLVEQFMNLKRDRNFQLPLSLH